MYCTKYITASTGCKGSHKYSYFNINIEWKILYCTQNARHKISSFMSCILYWIDSINPENRVGVATMGVYDLTHYYTVWWKLYMLLYTLAVLLVRYGRKVSRNLKVDGYLQDSKIPKWSKKSSPNWNIPDMISMLLLVHELLRQLSVQHIFPLKHVSAEVRLTKMSEYIKDEGLRIYL
jgi:hypothetical protein